MNLDQEYDIAVFDALINAGVDSWEWFNASVSHLAGDPAFECAAPEQQKLMVLEALEDGGVDSWVGYEIALESVRALQHEREESAPVAKLVPDTVPESESEARLRQLAADEYETLRDVFWKRTYAPKQFDLALRQTPPGKGFMERVRMRYLDLMFMGA